jgi:hypothetical protein
MTTTQARWLAPPRTIEGHRPTQTRRLIGFSSEAYGAARLQIDWVGSSLECVPAVYADEEDHA